MSRSFKKNPYCGDDKGKKKKRLANHEVRQKLKKLDYCPQFSSFKKLYESYDICDYGLVLSWEEYKKIDDDYLFWLKRYRNK